MNSGNFRKRNRHNSHQCGKSCRKEAAARGPAAACEANCATSSSALAAQRLVGHIGLTGDVAEWLKAAVC
jgi:hypothetical protein